MRSVLFAVTLLTSVSSSQGKPGVRCYVCENVEKPEDCTHIGQCTNTQQCHIRKYTNTLGYPMFDLGCEANTFCSFVSRGKRDVTKRQSTVVQWNRCCNQSYCNIDYDESGVAIQSKAQRCYHCDFVRDPAMCDRVTTCSGDDICFTYEKRNSLGTKGYGLTCKSRESCAQLYTTRYEQNATDADGTCQGCCDASSMCSDQICSTLLGNTSVPVYTPPPPTTTTPTPYLNIIESPSNVSARPGQSADIQCVAMGYPNVTVTWLCPPLSNPCDDQTDPNINQTDILTSERVESTLTIKNVTESDVGQYTCVADTDRENQTETAYVMLEEFLVVTINPPVLKLNEGSRAEFTCFTPGYPVPNATWYYLPEHGSQSEVTSGISVSGSESRLTINNATRNATGTYICVGENENGKLEKSVTLGVGISPVIVTPPVNQQEKISERVELFCNATGVPDPTLTWEFLSNHGDDFMTLVQVSLDKTRLVIDHVLPENAGSYTCVASNIIGNDTATAKITVS